LYFSGDSIIPGGGLKYLAASSLLFVRLSVSVTVWRWTVACLR